MIQRPNEGKNRPNPVNPGSNINTQTGQYTKGISDRTRGNTGKNPKKPRVPRKTFRPRRPKRPTRPRKSNRRPQLKRGRLDSKWKRPTRDLSIPPDPIGPVYNPTLSPDLGVRQYEAPIGPQRMPVQYNLGGASAVNPPQRGASYNRGGGSGAAPKLSYNPLELVRDLNRPNYPILPSGVSQMLEMAPYIPDMFQQWQDYTDQTRDYMNSIAQQQQQQQQTGGGGGGGGYSRRSYRPYSRRSYGSSGYSRRSYGGGSYGGGGGGGGAADAKEYEQYGITPEWMEAYKTYWGHELPKESWGIYDPIVQLFSKYTGMMPQLTDWSNIWSQMQEQAPEEEPLTDMWRPIYQYDPLFRNWVRPPLFTPPDVTYSQEQNY